jgi:hypothetical protein
MILNDKPNCQVSRILMNPRPILSDSSENDPEGISISKSEYLALLMREKKEDIIAVQESHAVS